LKDADVPVIAPLEIHGKTLFEIPDTGIFYCLFPCLQGRSPDELQSEDYLQLGRLMARLHNIGAQKKLQHRLSLDCDTFGQSNLTYLKEEKLIPGDLWEAVNEIAQNLFAYLSKELLELPQLRIHGDAHRGNLLRAQDQFYLVDFDDMISGPVIQDLWPLLPAHPHECPVEMNRFLEGYESFRPFPRNQIKLINPLRMLRYFHFAGWLARRWEDPSFKQAFPYFGDSGYWNQWLGDLHQLNALSFGAKSENTYIDDDEPFGNF
jgi:Ser/Thr protein kinase RdoA (MazF antagonist)